MPEQLISGSGTQHIAVINPIGGLGTYELQNFKQRVENSGGKIIYLGLAEPGTNTGSANWQIRKLSYDADDAITQIDFASGTSGKLNFDKAWDSREDYTYE